MSEVYTWFTNNKLVTQPQISLFSISITHLCWKTIQVLSAWGKSFLESGNKSEPKIDPWGTSHNRLKKEVTSVNAYFKLLFTEIGFKVALSGLRQFLANEAPLKMMKNAFYFTSKVLFVLKIFKFLSWLFSHVAKRLD